MKKIFIIMMLFSAAACMGMKENHASDFSAQRIKVSINVPDSGWRVRILEVHLVDKELWVFSEVYRLKGNFSQVISTIEDTVEIAAPSLPIVHFIIGKTWNWSDKKDSNRYINSREELVNDFDKGECLYQKRN